MLFDYDAELPEWALAEEYSHCRNLTERKVLRVVLTWLYLVNQRYKAKTLKYDNYIDDDPACLRKSQMERRYKLIADAIPGDRDPAHFVACVFELWLDRDKYHIFKEKNLALYEGLTFPSLKYLYTHAEELAKVWLSIEGYKPTSFLPLDDMRKMDVQIIENKIRRWCGSQDKTAIDFWCTPRQVFDVDARYMKFSTSLVEHREAVEKFWECSIEELMLFMEGLQAAMEAAVDKTFLKKWAATVADRAAGTDPMYPNLFILEDE